MLKKITFLSFLLLSTLSFADAAVDSCLEEAIEIVDKVKCLPNITVNKAYRNFFGGGYVIDMTITQPVDHSDPDSPEFEQRLALIYSGVERPMILQTSGYSIFGVQKTRLASEFSSNQLQVEHRYFSKSRPLVLDWSKLNIKQSADDFHAITLTFKKIFNKPWVNTGASKGGMTSIYHRFFYPDDVVGTVADVAPLSFDRHDSRYSTYLAKIGGEKFKACREAIKSLQRKLLLGRDEIDTTNVTGSFKTFGGVEAALQSAIAGIYWGFWQYQDANRGCLRMISLDESEDVVAIARSLRLTDNLQKDSSIRQFLPYYYQSHTELGGPDSYIGHIEDLLVEYKGLSMQEIFGENAPLDYSNESMLEVKEWAEMQADEVMYVYGETDPWTAAEFPVSKTGKNVYKFMKPAGNHGANFSNLPSVEKKKAIEIISKWLNVKHISEKDSDSSIEAITSIPQVGEGYDESLDALEFEVRRKLNL